MNNRYTVFVLSAVLLLFSTIDWVLTYIVLKAGGIEVMPASFLVVKHLGYIWLLVYKTLITLSLSFLCIKYRYPKLLSLACIAMGAVCGWMIFSATISLITLS